VRKIILPAFFLVFLWPAAKTVFAQSGTEKAEFTDQPVNSIVSCIPGSKAQADPAQAHLEAKRFYEAGVKHGLAKSFEQATTSFLLATCLKQDFADAYHGLGHAYFDLERWAESIKALERAVQLNPKDSEAFAMLGQAYLNLRRDDTGNSQQKAPEAVGEKVSHSTTDETMPKALPAESNAEANDRPLTNTYRLGIGDIIEIRLPNEPTAQTLYSVGVSGFLDHPLLSKPLYVSGLTTDEIRNRIEAELRTLGTDKQSEVSVEVREYSSHRVIVSGLVKEPGTKVLKREAIPLYVVLADAQPFPEANRAVIKSQQNSGSVAVDLTDSTAVELLVRPSDVITVDRAPQQFVYVGGEVKLPGERIFRRGLTLTQAILAAGGPVKQGKRIEVAREQSKGLLVVRQYNLLDIYAGKSPDPEILPGDRITVKK